jgi:5'-methylthioadenosine/S-adenosylhomocysteine nucleosidase
VSDTAPDTVKIVLLTAMGSEAEPIRATGLTVHQTGVGKVAAAAATERMIGLEKPDGIVFVGVAGGLAQDLRQLSVVIARDAVQWDVDITPVNGGLPGTLNDGRRFILLDAAGAELALEAAHALEYHARLGRVASGDAFLADQERARWIRETFSADAVEMEGAAALQIAHDHGVPMVLIRVISDHAGEAAELTYTEFLPAATVRAARVVTAFLPAWKAHLGGRART